MSECQGGAGAVADMRLRDNFFTSSFTRAICAAETGHSRGMLDDFDPDRGTVEIGNATPCKLLACTL